MATTKKTGNAPVQAAALPEAAPFNQRPPLHKAFEWSDPWVCNFIPAHTAISFFNLTRDITAGAVTALEIVERCQLEAAFEDDDARPLLSSVDQANLMRLAIASLQALNGVAEDRNEWVDKHGPEFAARERQEKAKGSRS